MQRPVESGRIIGNVEDDRVRAVCNLSGHNHVQDGAVVQDDRHKLENVDGDQPIIRVIFHVKQCTLLHLIREIQVSPKLEGYRVSASSMQACVAKGGSHQRLRHY